MKKPQAITASSNQSAYIAEGIAGADMACVSHPGKFWSITLVAFSNY